MNTDNQNQSHPEDDKINETHNKGRRDVLKTLATVPVLGAMAYGVYKKKKLEKSNRDISDVFQVTADTPVGMDVQPNGKLIRLGVIGFGIRGKQLMRAAGFAEPAWIDDLKAGAKVNSKDSRLQQYLEQDNLNVVVTGVCEIFDVYAEAAVKACSNVHREGSGGKMGASPKFYKHYKDLLAADDIDAVIIATPDHWHSTMAIEAAKAGKHVYLEKPLSWTLEETYLVRDAVRENGIIFQLGHQGRQTASYLKAKEIIDKGLIGQVSLIEMTTNRNSPNGAWVYPIIDGADANTIDWELFDGDRQRISEYETYMSSNNLEKYMGPEDRKNFSLERFFRWRCWWDYSSGLAGDLLTHEFDAVNQIMNVGIPSSAASSGGIYFFKDGRTVPDVMHTTFEFPETGLTLLYSATQSNSRSRGKVFMGHDASLELSNTLTLKVDPRSTRYKEKIEKGIITPDQPFYTFIPGQNSVDTITSPTELYFAQRGLLYTYVNGKRYDTTHLHIREWLECIRQGKTPSCNIDQAFDEAIASLMGTRSYLEGRTMYWDKDREQIVKS